MNSKEDPAVDMMTTAASGMPSVGEDSTLIRNQLADCHVTAL